MDTIHEEQKIEAKNEYNEYGEANYHEKNCEKWHF
jgi:hypothetical protein